MDSANPVKLTFQCVVGLVGDAGEEVSALCDLDPTAVYNAIGAAVANAAFRLLPAKDPPELRYVEVFVGGEPPERYSLRDRESSPLSIN